VTAKFPTWPGREKDLDELVAIHGPDQDAIALDAASKLPAGLYGQPYLAKVPSEREFAVYCSEWKAAGGVGMCVHSNSVDLAKRYPRFAGIIVDAGLVPVCVAGLDSDDPVGKAQRLGAILARDDCRALGHDLEGKGEDEAAQHEWRHAMDYVRELRRLYASRSRRSFSSISRGRCRRSTGLDSRTSRMRASAARTPSRTTKRTGSPCTGTSGTRSASRCSITRGRVLDARLSSQRLKRARWHTIQGYGHGDGMLDGLRYYLAKSLARCRCSCGPNGARPISSFARSARSTGARSAHVSPARTPPRAVRRKSIPSLRPR
jgi:hypothetical protein